MYFLDAYDYASVAEIFFSTFCFPSEVISNRIGMWPCLDNVAPSRSVTTLNFNENIVKAVFNNTQSFHFIDNKVVNILKKNR